MFGWFRSGRRARRAGKRGRGPGDFLHEAAGRIDRVVEAARGAADEIRADADAQRGSSSVTDAARRERLVAELAQTLINRAEALGRDAADLSRILERAASRLGPDGAANGTPLTSGASSATRVGSAGSGR